MDYGCIKRDFIIRTWEIVKQYDTHVLGNVDEENEFEVTLLMNCLLGLLVYPAAVASKRENQSNFNDWLTQDKVVDVGSDWGLEQDYFKSAGYKDEKAITIEQLTLRNCIRQMRNSASHADFKVHDDGSKSGKLRVVVFEDNINQDGFHLEMPVENLRHLICKLARSALDNIECPEPYPGDISQLFIECS